jgi:hypothetical protein
MVAGILGVSLLAWLVIGTLLVTLAIRAAVFVKLWAWFAVPTFGLPALGFATAAGLMAAAMVVQAPSMSSVVSPKKADDDDGSPMRARMYQLLIDAVFMPLVLLAIGWLFKGSV